MGDLARGAAEQEPFQGEQIIEQPLIIALLAVPILIQVYFNPGLAYLLSRQFGVAHCIAAPAALIGASNFFELAVAAAISLFGFESGGTRDRGRRAGRSAGQAAAARPAAVHQAARSRAEASFAAAAAITAAIP
jgi:hypothetical protein